MYIYGMRLRPFSIGCQPMEGLIEAGNDKEGEYWNILYYSRRLTDEETKQYDLDYIGNLKE